MTNTELTGMEQEIRKAAGDAERSPLKAVSNAPSCVPAVAGFEDTGSEIGPEEVREMMTWLSGLCEGAACCFLAG